eukprot:6641945-Pyramimonas_sp.AAC.1
MRYLRIQFSRRFITDVLTPGIYCLPSCDWFSRRVANPYAHFGIPTMWPRGYPINAGLDKGIDADAQLKYAA